jgi:hypothetical protein
MSYNSQVFRDQIQHVPICHSSASGLRDVNLLADTVETQI